jgi:PAS domain S-box-containing protein
LTTRINVGYGALMAVLGVSVFALPGLGAVSWALIGLVSAGAVAFGAYRHRAARPLAWWLFGAAIVAMAAGDTLYGVSSHNGPDSAPAVADFCYMAMFPLITVGMLTLVRQGAGLTDWSRMLDVCTFLCAAALLSWVFLTAPALATDGLTNADKSSLAAYNLGDLLILVTLVRLAFTARLGAASALLVTGAAALLAGDVFYTLGQFTDGWRPGGLADAAYLVFYATWGAAALQPSMVRVVTPIGSRHSAIQVRWAVLLGLSLTIPPTTLVVEAVAGQVRDGLVIAIVTGLMSALVVTRLVNALTQNRQALARERALRQASGSLLSVFTLHGVDAALHEAIGTLVPTDHPHRIVVAFPPELPPGDPGSGIVEPSALLPTFRRRLSEFPSVLVRPLRTEPGSDPLGVVLVGADAKVLHAIEDAVDVVAAQATLALDRMALTEQLHRRDSEDYLRTITRNSVDMVLIVDDDDLGIRYASTSVAATFGLDLPLLLSLHDLERSAESGQIARTLTTARRAATTEGTRDWWHLRRADGHALTLEVNCRDLRQDRTVRGYVITMRDITQDDPRQRELIQQALESSPAGRNRRSSHSHFQ